MLANLTQVNCYNRTGLNESFIDTTLLESAKTNLRNFVFFGMPDEQMKTQFLFEHLFGINFVENFEQREKTHISNINISKDMIRKIVQSNALDFELYQFAKELFDKRVALMEEKMSYSVDTYFEHIRDNVSKKEDYTGVEDDNKTVDTSSI